MTPPSTDAPRRPVPRLGPGVAACLGALLLVAGCAGGAVDVDPPDVEGTVESTCGELVDALPDSVDGADRREVTADAGRTAAAWGDPVIVLRCGVGEAEGFDDFATCQETDGVGWFIPQEQMTGAPEEITMTTIGRSVSVEVVLPPEHWPPAAAMVDLAPAIKQTVAETDPCV